MQNSKIISSPIITHSSYSSAMEQSSKKNWWLLIGGTVLLALGAFITYYLWGQYQKEKKEEKEAAMAEVKAKNAREQETQKRSEGIINSDPVFKALVHLSQNKGYPSSDKSQDDDFSRLFMK
jgi:cytochrome c-type biogenesis protein CcmH/NrfG